MLHWTRNWSNGAHWLVRFFFYHGKKNSYGVFTEYRRRKYALLLRILCVQPSVITPYELFPPRQKKNPTSQCAPLDQFLVQWSTLAGRIFVAGTMAHQNLKRKWGVTMLFSELPRLEVAKRGKNGIFAHTPPPVHMKVYESHPVALYSIRRNIFLNFMVCTPMYTGIRVNSWTSLSAANPKNVIFSTFACLLGQE